MKANWLGSLLFVLAVAIAGCGGGGGGGGTGSALGRLSVIADFQDATRTVPGYADTLRVTVTPPNGVTLPGGFPNPFVLTRASASRLLDDLTPSVSNYVLDMEALTDSTVVEIGSVEVRLVNKKEIPAQVHKPTKRAKAAISAPTKIARHSVAVYGWRQC